MSIILPLQYSQPSLRRKDVSTPRPHQPRKQLIRTESRSSSTLIAGGVIRSNEVEIFDFGYPPSPVEEVTLRVALLEDEAGNPLPVGDWIVALRYVIFRVETTQGPLFTAYGVPTYTAQPAAWVEAGEKIWLSVDNSNPRSPVANYTIEAHLYLKMRGNPPIPSLLPTA